MNKEKFLSEVTNRLSRQFHASKEGYRIADSERHRLEGFIQAGIFLQIATLTGNKSHNGGYSSIQFLE